MSRAARQADKRLLEIGAGDLEILNRHPALEQRLEYLLGLTAEQADPMVPHLEALHRAPPEGGLADGRRHAEGDPLARDPRFDLARRRVGDDDAPVDYDDAARPLARPPRGEGC